MISDQTLEQIATFWDEDLSLRSLAKASSSFESKYLSLSEMIV